MTSEVVASSSGYLAQGHLWLFVPQCHHVDHQTDGHTQAPRLLIVHLIYISVCLIKTMASRGAEPTFEGKNFLS